MRTRKKHQGPLTAAEKRALASSGLMVMKYALDGCATVQVQEFVGEASVRGSRCLECGLPPDGPGRTVHSDEGLPDDPDEQCPRCGRRLWFVIEISEAPGEGALLG